MDNLTHSLVGLTAAKAGLERLSPGATFLCVIAANSPDVDVAILLFGDRWTYLQHHRGITHAIVGVIALAVLLPLIFHGVDRLWSAYRKQPVTTKLRGLMIASLIVTATHPILDWTNNYGIRFLLPWNPQWFYLDLVYVVDPYMWLILGGAVFLLSAKTNGGKFIWGAVAVVITALMLLSSRAGALPNRTFFIIFWVAAIITLILLFRWGAATRWGPKIAVGALWVVVFYWTGLTVVQALAFNKAIDYADATAAANRELLKRASIMPTLANPLRWDLVFETNRATYRSNFRLLDNNSQPKVVRYEKPSGALAKVLENISQERSVRIFLGFARYPVAQLADPQCATQTLVEFADLRYTEPSRSRGPFTLNLPVACPTNDEGGR